MSYGDYSSFYKNCFDWKSVITCHTDGAGMFANTILNVPHSHYENLSIMCLQDQTFKFL